MTAWLQYRSQSQGLICFAGWVDGSPVPVTRAAESRIFVAQNCSSLLSAAAQSGRRLWQRSSMSFVPRTRRVTKGWGTRSANVSKLKECLRVEQGYVQASLRGSVQISTRRPRRMLTLVFGARLGDATSASCILRISCTRRCAEAVMAIGVVATESLLLDKEPMIMTRGDDQYDDDATSNYRRTD